MNEQSSLFAMTNHDGITRTVPAGADAVRVPPRKRGLDRKLATPTRDASFQRRKESGEDAALADALLGVYAKYGPAAERKYGHEAMTDREAHKCLTVGEGRNDLTSSLPRARKALQTRSLRPLIVDAEPRACRVTGRTATPWRLSAAGWEAAQR